MNSENNKPPFKPTRLVTYDNKSIIAEIRRVVTEHFDKNCPTVSEFNRHSRVKAVTIIKRFGSWADAMQAAGFLYERCRISRSALINDLKRVSKLNYSIYFTSDFYVQNGKYSPKTLKKRLGYDTWESLLENVLSLKKNQKIYKIIKPRPSAIPEDKLLPELKRVWNRLGRRPSYGEFKKMGRFPIKGYERAFGTWTNAVQACCDAYNYQIQGGKGLTSTPQILLSELKAVAQKNETSILDFAKYRELGGSYSIGTFQNTFGSWRKAVEKIGLNTGRSLNYSDDMLFDEIQRLWESLGRQPKTREVKKSSKISFNTFVKRFGSWTKAVYAFCTDRGTISEKENELEYWEEELFKVEQKNQEESVPDINDSVEHSVPKNGVLMTTPRFPSPRVRFRVLSRDSFTCVKCGRSPENTLGLVLHVDHKKPYSKGGETIEENLQTLCAECNIGKSDLVL